MTSVAPDFDPNDLIAELGMPHGAPWVRVASLRTVSPKSTGAVPISITGIFPMSIGGPIIQQRRHIHPAPPFDIGNYKDWIGYRFDFFGQRVDAPPPPGGEWPFCIVPGGAPDPRDDPDTQLLRWPLIFQFWRLQAFHEQSKLYAELRWHPGWKKPRAFIGGGEERHSPLETSKADRGMTLLLDLNAEMHRSRDGGRPTYYTFPEDDAKFFADLQKAVREAVRRGADVNPTALAALGVGLAKDRRTVGTYIDGSGYDLEKIRAEAKRCVNRLSNCSVNVRDRAKFKKNRA